MALLQIVKEGDPVLRGTSRPVDKITPRIIRLLDDMRDTLEEAQGAGLAAPQVGVLRRIVLVNVEDVLYELINPEIIERSDDVQRKVEGCLSVPDKWGITVRPKTVKVRAMNRDGETVEYTGTGLLARAFCHELDHLDGKLYTDNVVRMLTDKEVERLGDGKKIKGVDEDDEADE